MRVGRSVVPWQSIVRVLAAGLLLCLSSARPALAGPEPVGVVKSVLGEAWVGQPGALVPATVGTQLHAGDTMKTGAGGALGVTLRDNTVMAFGPGSEARVDEFTFEPDGGEGRMVASLLRGTLNVVTGMIAKLRPDAQLIRTPTATLGVRGTHFLVKVDEQRAATAESER